MNIKCISTFIHTLHWNQTKNEIRKTKWGKGKKEQLFRTKLVNTVNICKIIWKKRRNETTDRREQCVCMSGYCRLVVILHVLCIQCAHISHILILDWLPLFHLLALVQFTAMGRDSFGAVLCVASEQTTHRISNPIFIRTNFPYSISDIDGNRWWNSANRWSLVVSLEFLCIDSKKALNASQINKNSLLNFSHERFIKYAIIFYTTQCTQRHHEYTFIVYSTMNIMPSKPNQSATICAHSKARQYAKRMKGNKKKPKKLKNEGKRKA